MILGEVLDVTRRPVGGSVSPVDYMDWREQQDVFSHLAAYRGNGFNVTGLGEPQRMIGMRVGSEYFGVLGTAPVLGRDFTAGDDICGAPNVVVISHGFWQRQFARSADVLNRSVLLNGEPFTIVGVVPESLREVTSFDFWLPIAFQPSETAQESRDLHYINVIGRLKPGVSVEAARTGMNVIAERLAQLYPAS